LGGLDTLTSGYVVVDGVDLSKLRENELVRYRAEKVGFVFQQFHLVPYLTAVENVMLAQYFHSVTDEKQAKEALKRVGLGDRLTHLPAQLSGGEPQRVAMARALINQPRIDPADAWSRFGFAARKGGGLSRGTCTRPDLRESYRPLRKSPPGGCFRACRICAWCKCKTEKCSSRPWVVGARATLSGVTAWPSAS